MVFTNAIGSVVIDEGAGGVNVGVSQHFIDVNQPDILMSDYYPLRISGVTFFSDWLNYLETVRSLALANNLPYHTWLQGDGEPSMPNGRLASESDLRMLLFSGLTYGFSGFNYLSYLNQTQDLAIVDREGNPTHVYYSAQAAHPEVFRLGEVLKYATSDSVFFIPGQVFGIPNPVWGDTSGVEWQAGIDPDDHMVEITILEDGNRKNGLIGFFTADDGEELFMLTNLHSGQPLTAAAGLVTFEVVFDDSVDSLLRLNRLTGEEEVVALTNHTLTTVLPGGTGDLYKYVTGGSFAIELAGDVNGDGWVAGGDLSVIISNWGMTGATREQGDLNGNGTVDGPDYTEVLTYWGAGIPPLEPPSGIPEPATLGLLLIGGLALLGRRFV